MLCFCFFCRDIDKLTSIKLRHIDVECNFIVPQIELQTNEWVALVKDVDAVNLVIAIR